MAVLRLTNGTDVVVKMTVDEALSAITGDVAGDRFVKLPGEDGAVHVRPSGVIAVIDDARRGSAGFRVGLGSDPSSRS
ncbi:MAG TPA: hypothetical protein VE219_05590 [Candidatus Sulfotelmatobacter sp.]|jgi:hypothetical protein|nr:hypothetical protein [Candidatus Sulfotelmatobacter sp.]